MPVLSDVTEFSPIAVSNINTQLLSEKTLEIQQALSVCTDEPFMLVDIGMLRRRIRLLQDCFEGEVAFAVKANPRAVPLLCEQMRTFDCATRGEIERVLTEKPDANILYGHPVPKPDSVRFAAENKIKYYTVQSIEGAQSILDETKRFLPREELIIAVRLLTPNEKAGINLSDKFGTSPAEVLKIIQFIKRNGARAGITMHTGSQNPDPHSYAKAIKSALQIAKEVQGISLINVGGGLPANIFPGDNYDMKQYMKAINNAFNNNEGAFCDGKRKTLMEPGRAIIAEPMKLIIPVISVQNRGGYLCLKIHDSVLNQFSDVSVHHWEHPMRVIDSEGNPVKGKQVSYTIFGNTRNERDIIRAHAFLPQNIDPENHFIVVDAAGAYLDSQSRKRNTQLPYVYFEE